MVPYTEEEIERIAAQGEDPKNWQPADPEAWELGRRMADGIAATYTDEDWRRILNALSPRRAARKISLRPPEDRRRLLELVSMSSTEFDEKSRTPGVRVEANVRWR